MAQPSQRDFQKKSSPSPVAAPSQAMAPRPFAPQVDVAAPDVQTPDVAAPDALTLDNAPAFPKLNFQIRAAGGSPPPLQPKLTIGAPNDPYEQEADRVAAQVVQRIHSPAANPPKENPTYQAPSVQRQAGPEQPVLEMKSTLQRETLPDEDDELQMKPMLQRLEMSKDDELQMKPMPQRSEMPPGVKLQMKSTFSEGVVEGDASPDLEAGIQRARGNGQALAPTLQMQMGQAMGADFSGVRVHTDTQSDQLNRSIQAKAFTTGQDIFFRQGAYQPENRGGQELIAHELTHVIQQRSEVIQRYTVYDPAIGHTNITGYNPNSTFNAQDKNGTGSFMDPGTNAPRILGNPNGNNTPVRISQNGTLAVEDADLTNRQPKYFFADSSLIQQWNERLMKVGSDYQLVVNNTETLQFTLQGIVKNLVRVDARNLRKNTAGNALTTAQNCDSTIKEVIGSFGDPKVILGRQPTTAIPNQPGFQTVYEQILHYYIADELGGGGRAGNIDLKNQPNNLPALTQAIANDYGTAMYQHKNMAANPVLDNAAQQMGVNEYAIPDVGEGIVTHRLGETVGGQVRDNYNNRNEPNPGNSTLWRYHWGGVIAKDGNDYITLENYARNAEDNLGDTGDDPRFYFQMYGAAAQSWHEQWATIHPGGRNFANPLTMKLKPGQPGDSIAGGHYNATAAKYFNNAAIVADDHNTVAAVTNEDQFAIALYKALTFANDQNVGDRDAGDMSRIYQWRAALASAARTYQNLTSLYMHVLNQFTANAYQKYDLDAQNQYGANIAGIKDDHNLVAGAANSVVLANQLRKGLAYANSHPGNQKGRRSRVTSWRNAVNNAPYHPETAELRAHTLTRLNAMRRTLTG